MMRREGLHVFCPPQATSVLLYSQDGEEDPKEKGQDGETSGIQTQGCLGPGTGRFFDGIGGED